MELYICLAVLVVTLVVRDLLRTDPIAPPFCDKCNRALEVESQKGPAFRSNLIGAKVKYTYRCPRCGRKETIVVKEYSMTP